MPLDPILQGLQRLSAALRNLDESEIASKEASNVARSASSDLRSKLEVRSGETTVCEERFSMEALATVATDGL